MATEEVNQGHPEFKTVRIADLLREAGIAPTDPMTDILEGHRYLLLMDSREVSANQVNKIQGVFEQRKLDILALLVPPGSCRMFDVSETGEEYFAYNNSHLLCAECGWALSSTSSNFTVRPFDYIVHCFNSSCSRKEIRFRVRASQGVRLEKL